MTGTAATDPTIADASAASAAGAAGTDLLPRTAWARIDLDAIAGNLAAIRRVLPSGVRVEPVVKADAYGHGAVMVARVLAEAGADGFCVAAFDEALQLRRAGIRQPILVLFPVPPEHALEAARRGIALTVGDPELLRRTLALAGERARTARAAGRRTRSLRLHLEVETGLGRGGLLPEAVVAAARSIRATPGTALVAIWSHLATPEDPAVAGRQGDRFAAADGLLADARVAVARRHLASSGGLLGGNVPTYDAVRIGLATYGLIQAGFPVAPGRRAAAEGLVPAMSLHARPVRVVDLPAGQGIGYDATFVTSRPSRIATLPLGYGDGWARAYSNRAEALVRGVRVPLVGNVSMDSVMADVTDVPGAPVGVDDEFVLLGTQGAETIAAADLARARGTNAWEVVTAVSRRVTRVFTRDGRTVGVRTLLDD